MSYVLLDDSFYDHPKTVAVGRDARDLWLRCLTWAQKYRTDGFVPESTLRQQANNEGLSNVDDLIERLLTCYIPDKGPFLHRVEGGFRIHEYEDYYEKLLAKRAGTRERVRRHREGKQESTDQDESCNALPSVTVTEVKRVSHRYRNRDLIHDPDLQETEEVGESTTRDPVPPAPPPSPAPTAILGKPKSKEQAALVQRHEAAARELLDEWNAARKRLNSKAHGFSPSYENLGPIAQRLDEGDGAAERIRHVIAVCEASVRDGSDPKWFNPFTACVSNWSRNLSATLPLPRGSPRPQAQGTRNRPTWRGGQ